MASFLLAASAANAATIKVTTTSDSGTGAGDCAMTDQACSLRQAVNAASNGDIVKVPAGKYTLTQTSQSLYIATNITLSGAGARRTIIKQVNELGVVAIDNGVTATIQGVTITGGKADSFAGGGGINNGGTLTLKKSTVTGNEAGGSNSTFGYPSMTFCFAGSGGGIANLGGAPLTIVDSTISGNTASSGTGAGASGGGIYSDYPVTVINSTIANNTAQGGVAGGCIGYSGGSAGGGIYMFASQGTPTLRLANATVAFNRAREGATADGGNIDLQSGVTGSAKNSVFAGGVAKSASQNCVGKLKSGGYNLEDHNQCGLHGTGDEVNTPARLGSLNNHGGPTNTVALLSGSPAINRANPGGCRDQLNVTITTDQRGVHRPQGGRCDIGAFEFRVPTLKGSPRISGTPKVGQRLTCLLPAIQSPDGSARISVAWLRSGAPVASGRTYVVKSADKGHSLSCRVKVANAAGSVSATSGPSQSTELRRARRRR